MIHELLQYFLLLADALFIGQWIWERRVGRPRPFAG